MDSVEEIKLLTEIKETLKANNIALQNMIETLRTDRAMLWKVLLITIVGSFTLVGVKLVFP